MGKREGKLRHGLAETVWSWPTPFTFGEPPSVGPYPAESLASTSQARRPRSSHSPGPRAGRAGRPPHSRTLDSRTRSCFWQRDLVPRGHTRRCADTGRLPPGSRTSRFCRIRLLARAAMAPREETPPNLRAPGARWAPQEKPVHQGMFLTLGSQLAASPTGPEDEPQAPHPSAASSHRWAPCYLHWTQQPVYLLTPPSTFAPY